MNSSRKDFEAWASAELSFEPHDFRRDKWDEQEYEKSDTRFAWKGWQASRKQALQEAYDAMFDIKGDKVTRFDAQTAIRALKGPGLTDLLPCCCGSNNTYVGGAGDAFAGFCAECNSSGPAAADEEAAAALWNDSVSDAARAPA